MTQSRGFARRAAQFVASADGRPQDGPAPTDPPRPTSWPGLTDEEAPKEWERLRCWVEALRDRFPNIVRLPECWWRHNDLVEALSALRDFEHGCFAPTAQPTAPVEWHRALRDMEARMDVWIRRFTCTVSDRGHDRPAPNDVPPPGWNAFVTADVQRRRARSQNNETGR